MEILKTLFQWLIYSSKRPENFSMTIKSLAVLFLLVGVEQGVVDAFSNSFVETGMAWMQVLAGLSTLYGLGRKIWFTFAK